MQTPASLTPDLEHLGCRLTAALGVGRRPGSSVEVLARVRPRFMSTFPNEIVTCRMPDGSTRRLFLKYEAGLGQTSHGHRGGPAYEGEVYRNVLAPLEMTRPGFYGVHTERGPGGTWLLIEHLERVRRVKDIPVRRSGPRRPPALLLAARWIARFHALMEESPGRRAPAFLTRYDADYYNGWPRRTSELAGPRHDRFPWLRSLCDRAGELLEPLLGSGATIIHGEYYTNNILLRRGRIYPVDWEAAAVAPGEIDLAALTEGRWPPWLVRWCEREYGDVRWPEGAPESFARRLEAARLYLHFRWLGDRPDWTRRGRCLWRFGRIRAAAERLGLTGCAGEGPRGRR